MKECDCICHVGYWKETLENCTSCKGENHVIDKVKKQCDCNCHLTRCKEPLTSCMKCSKNNHITPALPAPNEVKISSKSCSCMCHVVNSVIPGTYCADCFDNHHTNEKSFKEKKKLCSCDNAKESCADCLGKNYERPKEKEEVKKEKEELRRERDKVGCEAIGYKIACDGEICWAHIMTRSYKALKSSKNNRVWVCKSHENYFNTEGKHEWDVFVMTRFPDRWNFILKKYTEGSEANKVIKEYFKV